MDQSVQDRQYSMMCDLDAYGTKKSEGECLYNKLNEPEFGSLRPFQINKGKEEIPSFRFLLIPEEWLSLALKRIGRSWLLKPIRIITISSESLNMYLKLLN